MVVESWLIGKVKSTTKKGTGTGTVQTRLLPRLVFPGPPFYPTSSTIHIQYRASTGPSEYSVSMMSSNSTHYRHWHFGMWYFIP